MDRYFKYLTPAGARPTLLQGTLRWSRPSRFNDLFDMAVPYSSDCDTEFVVDRTLELMWARVQNPGKWASRNEVGLLMERLSPRFVQLGREAFNNEMRPGIEQSLANHPERIRAFGKEIVEHLKTIKVLCLSRTHDDNAMWGLYAENHRGVVLEFENVDGFDSVYRIAKPVNYDDRPPPLLDDEELASFLAGNIDLTPDLAEPLMFLKSNHWQYEKELRIVTGEGRDPRSEFEDVPFHPRELAAVYFGARAQDLRTEIESQVKEKFPHATRWQAYQGDGFQIDFRPLE